jgi:hypothetical protein
MARIRIGTDDLTTAMSNHDSEWVLDLETGAVLMAAWVRDPDLRGDIGLDPVAEELDDLDDDDAPDPLESGRFLPIDSIESHEGFRWMERFAEGQDDDRVRECLLDALDRPRPFRRFRDALHEFPPVLDAWYSYEKARLREEAEAWLRLEQIDAELVDNRPRPPAGDAGG